MKHAAIIGTSGGIGSALTQRLCERDDFEVIYGFSRSKSSLIHPKLLHQTIDITQEDNIQKAATFCEHPLDLIIVSSGMLKAEPHLPEKSLRDLDFDAMQNCFAVNTFGPALVAKHFLPLLPKDKRGVFAALSARVGSISDNRIGGWYSYRASKAALNMMIKNTAIEVNRRYKQAIILSLHPGTVDTDLSKPFKDNVRHEIFAPDQAADYLLNVIEKATPEDTGKCFAWDGQEITP